MHLCEGVQHAHQKGIIHRDLKPSNVLVTVQDDHPVPKIIDFGIAKATSHPLTEHTLYTSLGGPVGTREYMSPEQAEIGGVDIDTRTDIYTLGVILYELLTGVLPFDRQQFMALGIDEVRRTIREVNPPRPSTRVTPLQGASTDAARNRRIEAARFAGLLRGDLDWITMKALEKARTRRYGSASDLAADVRRHLANHPVLAGPPSAAYRTRKFVQRHRFGVFGSATLLLLLTVFAIVMAVQAQRIARERDRANSEARRANQEAVAAKQVSDFLVGLFKVSDPTEARGKTLTARDILDQGARQLESSLRDQPRVHARLQTIIGVVYSGLGLFAEAQPLLIQALETHKKTVGEEAAETLETMNHLANLYWHQRRFQEAEVLYRDIVQQRTRIYRCGPPGHHEGQFRSGKCVRDARALAGIRGAWRRDAREAASAPRRRPPRHVGLIEQPALVLLSPGPLCRSGTHCLGGAHRHSPRSWREPPGHSP